MLDNIKAEIEAIIGYIGMQIKKAEILVTRAEREIKSRDQEILKGFLDDINTPIHLKALYICWRVETYFQPPLGKSLKEKIGDYEKLIGNSTKINGYYKKVNEFLSRIAEVKKKVDQIKAILEPLEREIRFKDI